MNFFDSLVGPVPKSYCLYFYIGAILSFCLFAFAAFDCLASLFSKGKFDMNKCTMMLYPLFGYFINRVYYNMCMNSL
jgi:hypothetical protein